MEQLHVVNEEEAAGELAESAGGASAIDAGTPSPDVAPAPAKPAIVLPENPNPGDIYTNQNGGNPDNWNDIGSVTQIELLSSEKQTPIGFAGNLSIPNPANTLMYLHRVCLLTTPYAGKKMTFRISERGVESLIFTGENWIPYCYYPDRVISQSDFRLSAHIPDPLNGSPLVYTSLEANLTSVLGMPVVANFSGNEKEAVHE